MACVQCGSSEVGNLQYCSNCIRERRESKQKQKQTTFASLHKQDSKFDQIIFNPFIWIGVGIFAYLILIGACLLVGPLKDKGVVASILFATILMGMFLSLTSVWLIRVKKVVAGASLSQYKAYYALSVGSVLTTIVCSWLLAQNLNISYTEARQIVERSIFSDSQTNESEYAGEYMGQSYSDYDE